MRKGPVGKGSLEGQPVSLKLPYEAGLILLCQPLGVCKEILYVCNSQCRLVIVVSYAWAFWAA